MVTEDRLGLQPLRSDGRVVMDRWRCRCEDCKAWRAAHVRRRRRLVAYGTYIPTSLVDPTGTQRRIQALMCMGWSLTAQAHRVGRERRNYGKTLLARKVTAVTARLIAGLYVDWSDVSAPVTAASARARNNAKRLGYASPLSWDDDTIDDPDAKPADHVPNSEQVDEFAVRLVCEERIAMRLRGADRIEAIRRLSISNVPTGDQAALLLSHRDKVEALRRKYEIAGPQIQPKKFSRKWTGVDR